MTKKTDFELLRYSRCKRGAIKFSYWFLSIPHKLKNLLFKIGNFFKRIFLFFVNDIKDIGRTFKKGSYKTKLSYVFMGFGSFARKQIGRGILFMGFEALYIVFMTMFGSHYLARLGSLGTVAHEYVRVLVNGVWVQQIVYHDNSFKILLYSIITIIVSIAFIYTWRLNIKQNKICEEIEASGKKVKSTKDDLRSLVDNDFHKTLLALPTVGILLFTVLPIVFMILIAFTNYDMNNTPPYNLFHWIGLDNFNQLFGWSSGSKYFSAAFGEILAWTLVWAVLATFTNYFLGMAVAMLINKKGIKIKKMWRTILIITIAVPQFVSLLFVSKMFTANGIINTIFHTNIDFWNNRWIARSLVIVINIWIGIPYLMLITTGILMNIPSDLYESAKIDGASPWKQYAKITLPYMLFVTGPYLLTSFIANMNNFNVIYLLTGGGPKVTNSFNSGGTDLLITWLFKLTVDNHNYKFAAVIGIMVFLVVAVISLIVYNLLPSTRNEEEFQ